MKLQGSFRLQLWKTLGRQPTHDFHFAVKERKQATAGVRVGEGLIIWPKFRETNLAVDSRKEHSSPNT